MPHPGGDEQPCDGPYHGWCGGICFAVCQYHHQFDSQLAQTAFVTIADRFLAAYLYQTSKTLGPYIPLIIVNCIIISRCEVCASKQSIIVAGADAVGQSLGFALALLSIAVIREVLGTGTFFGLSVLPAGWPNWVIMVLPPGAFFTFGLLLAAVNWLSTRRDHQGNGL